MGRKNRDFLKMERLTLKDKTREEKLIKKRELHQAKIILENTKLSKNVVFVSVGAYHLRKGSYLLSALSSIKYIIFYPTYNRKRLFEPENVNEKELVYFFERSKNH